MSPSADLSALRRAIEALDARLLDLLAERMELVERVATAKLDAAWPFRDASREERMLLHLRELAAERGLDPHEVERLYRVVLDMSVAHQQAHVRALDSVPLRVTYQGTEGSYSHLAAQRRYAGRGGGVLLAGHETFRGAADAVVAGQADLALLPIENTTAGSINETYDLLTEDGLVITGEVVEGIEHCLLALPGADLAGIRRVLSHPQALRQCEAFLRAHPALEAVAAYDTAGAARRVRDANDPAQAAIASLSAATTYGLEVLARGIQSEVGNATRFVEVGRTPMPLAPGARAKTSLLLVLSDRPGALGEVLGEFSRRSLNLTKLESRPIPDSPFRYRFYLDVEGHASSEAFRGALDALQPLVASVRLLGTYPAASGAPDGGSESPPV